MLAEVLQQSSGLVVLEGFDALLCIINEHEIHDWKPSCDTFFVTDLIIWQAEFLLVKTT